MSLEPQPNMLIAGQYTLTRCLGTGGVGIVWEATAADGQCFALKFLHSVAFADSGTPRRFRREARIVKKLDHPSVAKTFDVVEFSGSPVIVMELCSGYSLRRYFLSHGPLSYEKVGSVLLSLALALQYCHEAGVVHRDVKPENIFVTDEAASDLGVRLIDFGFAKFQRTDADGTVGSVVTELGTRIGTPWYMAPEQILDPDAIDWRIDSWSVGVVAYEALAGCLPIEGATGSEVMRRILSDAIVPLELLAPGTPPEMVRIVMAALERSRELRPSMSEFVGVLRPYAQSQPRS